MNVDVLRDDQWCRIEAFVPGGRKGKCGPRSNNRRFINALLWMARSGARWRDLPLSLGSYQTVKWRYYGWIENGTILKLFKALSAEADLDWLQLDATIIHAHKHAAGAPHKRGYLHPRDWAAHVIADRAYDAHSLMDLIYEQGVASPLVRNGQL